MRGLVVLLVAVLLLVAIEGEGLPAPALPWGFWLDDGASATSGAGSYRAGSSPLRRYVGSTRSARQWPARQSPLPEPIARLQAAQQRLDEGGDHLELAVDRLRVGLTRPDWQSIKRSANDLRSARDAIGEAIDLLRSS